MRKKPTFVQHSYVKSDVDLAVVSAKVWLVVSHELDMLIRAYGKIRNDQHEDVYDGIQLIKTAFNGARYNLEKNQPFTALDVADMKGDLKGVLKRVGPLYVTMVVPFMDILGEQHITFDDAINIVNSLIPRSLIAMDKWNKSTNEEAELVAYMTISHRIQKYFKDKRATRKHAPMPKHDVERNSSKENSSEVDELRFA